MKVLLCFPGRREFLEPEPLNLEALAGMIPDCDIKIADLRFDDVPVRKIIESFAPNVVATTATTSCVYQAQDILKTAKEIDEKILTLVGGSHPSAWPGDFNLPYVDAVVIGMGEDAFREIIEAVSRGKGIRDIKGIAIPGKEGITLTEPRELNKNLDSFPFPRRDLTKKYHHRYRYVIGKYGMAMISTSRGCPNRCSFCAIWRLMGGKYITRSPESVVEELATIKQKVIRFADGNTFGNIKRMHSLCDLIIASGLKKRFVMDISTNIVVKQSKLIEKMREAGFSTSVLGIESIVDEKLGEINKSCTVEEHNEAINILHKNGILIAGNFLIEPDFEPKDFDRVEEYIVKKNIGMPIVNITTPLPGTALFDEKKNDILTDNYDYFDLRHLVLPSKIKRKIWWKKYRKLNRRCMKIIFQKFPTVESFVLNTAVAAISWKSRNEYLLKKPGRAGTRLHEIVSKNARPVAGR